MAVPKKRTGHSAQGHRRSNWKATKPEITTCPNCGAAVLTHTVCTACGTYKGQPVSLKDRKDAVEVKEEKKPAKKSTKKADKAEEKVEKKTKKSQAKAEKKEEAEEVKAETAVEETPVETTAEEKTEE